MPSNHLRLLLVMEQCHPDWPSVPGLAFRLYDHLRRLSDVTLVTHSRNGEALRAACPGAKIHVIEESNFHRHYYRWIHRLTSRGGMNWPLHHALSYPLYAHFNREVDRQFGAVVKAGGFDAVMGMTPILPRYPYQIARSCETVPFILGPVNGGLPFPNSFLDVARKEHAGFNVLRAVGRLLPGYRATYEKADRIIAGSTFTRDWIQDYFGLEEKRLSLVAENGVAKEFFRRPLLDRPTAASCRVLFAGRLVPYKGADMLIEAFGRASKRSGRKLELTLVGDGPERPRLEQMVKLRGLDDRVRFTGDLAMSKMPDQFAQADVFAFPSVREFGGAVVLEAMAAGVPCIVADHGGIGEYVTDETGVKMSRLERGALVEDLEGALLHLSAHPEELRKKALASRERARRFSWESKVEAILNVVREAIDEKQGRADSRAFRFAPQHDLSLTVNPIH